MEEPNDPTPNEKGRLGFIRPRATKEVGQHRARIIGWLKFGLPAAAALVLIVLLFWPEISPSKIAAIALKNAPDLVIRNLHFTGQDSKSEPYSLTAEKATRPGGLKNVYDFDKPRGDITLTDGAWLAGTADYGRYDQDQHQMWFGGDVQLFHDKGYEFTTDEAWVDLNDNNAWGGKPVLIQGDFGEIRGEGFKLLDGGKTMVVTGPAHATLDLHHSAGSDKPAQAQ